jgi:hypothetical protein
MENWNIRPTKKATEFLIFPGVVLRGSGCNSEGTIIVGTGAGRETLIRIAGINNRKMETPLQLADNYFPVNSTVLTFKNGHNFKVGDHVIVNRPIDKRVDRKDWR